MVDIVLKLAGQEVSVTTANTVNGSVLFRVYSPSESLITIRDANNAVIGTMTQPAGFVEIIEKRKTDTIEANTAIKCTPVAYK